jgi:hypothetical protein
LQSKEFQLLTGYRASELKDCITSEGISFLGDQGANLFMGVGFSELQQEEKGVTILSLGDLHDAPIEIFFRGDNPFSANFFPVNCCQIVHGQSSGMVLELGRCRTSASSV